MDPLAEAKRAEMLSSEEAEKLSDISNIKQAGARKGNWLTREQAKELLAVPDRSKLKGKRDYVILSLFSSSVLGDCLAHQARRASGSTVVPSQLFASRPGRKLC